MDNIEYRNIQLIKEKNPQVVKNYNTITQPLKQEFAGTGLPLWLFILAAIILLKK